MRKAEYGKCIHHDPFYLFVCLLFEDFIYLTETDAVRGTIQERMLEQGGEGEVGSTPNAEFELTTLRSTSEVRGTWMAHWVKHLPSTQVMIPGPGMEPPNQAPHSAESLLLPLCLHLLMLSGLLSQISKNLSKRKKKRSEIKIWTLHRLSHSGIPKTF